MLDEITGDEDGGGWVWPIGRWSRTPDTATPQSSGSACRRVACAMYSPSRAHQRLPGRCHTGNTALQRPRSASGAALTATTRQPCRPGHDSGPPCAAPRYLAPRLRKNARNPNAAMASRFLALRVRRRTATSPQRRRCITECRLIAEWPPGKPEPANRLLALHHGLATRHYGNSSTGEDPLAHRTRLPRTQRRPRPGPLQRPQLSRLAPPRHTRCSSPGVLHTITLRPKSPCAGA